MHIIQYNNKNIVKVHTNNTSKIAVPLLKYNTLIA
jgi:hypothetical protein